MVEPWFDLTWFAGLYGGLAGGLGGTALGVTGGYGGDRARKGRRRRWVNPVLYAVLALGLASLGTACLALALGQPPGIWGPLGGVGLLLSLGAGQVGRTLKRLARKQQ